MSLKNIKSNSQGFTIVELLIVVVVIAILAAITIVSYNGITNRANASAAQSAAASVQKKAEAYNAENSAYPSAFSDLIAPTASSSDTWFLTGVAPTGGFGTAPTSANGKNTVQYIPCGVTSTVNTATPPANQAAISIYTGAEIRYFAFSGSTVNTVTVGQADDDYVVVSGTDERAVGCPTTAS